MEVGQVLRWFGTFAAVVLGISRKPSFVWLIGLAIVIRGSKPEQRPEILRAYGDAQPPAKEGR